MIKLNIDMKWSYSYPLSFPIQMFASMFLNV